MATKTVVTRIKNKVDTLAKWQAYTGTLLDGEIAVVRVPTGETYTNPVTGVDEPVVELLMKVGDGSTAFAELPWMSAKASDVYDWGKAKTVEFNTSTYKVEFKDASGNAILAVDLTSIDARLDALESKKIIVTPNDSSKPGVVQSIAQGDASHEIDVTYGLIKTADIDDKQVTAAKIADSTITATQLASNAVSTAKIANGAVTNDKVAAGVSSDKISIGTGTTDGTLSKKLAEVDAALAGVKGSFSVTPASATANAVVQGVTYNNATGEFTVSYGTVAAGDIASSAVTTAKIKDANVTTAKIADANVTTAKIKDANVTDAKIAAGVSSDKITVKNTSNTLTTKLASIDASIESLNATISKGIIFRGEVASAPSGTTYTLKDTSTAVAAVVGDMVICGEKEYVYVASSDWKELGDLGRVTTLETWRSKLQKADTAVTNQFVTEVDIAADGTVTVNRAQPTSANVSHSGSTVKAALENLAANKSDSGHTHTISAGAEDDDVVVLTGTAGTNGVSYKATHANSGVTAGTYRSVTVNAKGHITAGSNPTTLSGYGITDAYTKSEVYTKSDVYTKTETNAELAKKSNTDHTHSAYVNQNAFSKIAVSGQTTVEAESATDTVTFAGSNVTITTDATNDKITFKVAKADADGETGIVTLEDSVVNQSTTAATSKAVYSVNTKAENAQSRAGAIEANYVRVDSNNNLVHSVSGTDYEIILDCGGAE